MLNQMNVRGLLFDPYNNAYIVILRDEEHSDMLPNLGWKTRGERH